MASPSATSVLTANMEVKGDVPQEFVDRLTAFLGQVGASDGEIPDHCKIKDFHSDLIRGLLLTPYHLQRGRLTCHLSVKPAATNIYGTLHGGVVASIAEIVSIACASTVVANDKDIFLGELSISYLSGAPLNAEVIVDSSVVRSGRNLTVISVEFKHKETGRLTYTARSTFYTFPVAKL